jgi:hypothetical protein
MPVSGGRHQRQSGVEEVDLGRTQMSISMDESYGWKKKASLITDSLPSQARQFQGLHHGKAIL